MKPGSHIHLIGICGTAMASLAGLLQQRGHRVTGSDAAAYPPMSELLRSLGIPVMEPYAAKNLQPAPDLVIVGNAISRGNPELEFVLEHRVPMQSLAAILHDEFLADSSPLVIAGTHGKTTTTSMLAWILATAAQKEPRFTPSFLIGGVAENFGTSFAWHDSKPDGQRYFVIEGDEYDTAFFDKGPKFLHYFPQAMVLTHVEFDHADIYHSLAEVKTAFQRLVNLVPRNGRVIAYDGHENVDACVARAFCPVERYGFRENSFWRIAALTQDQRGTHWQLFRDGKLWADLSMPMAGEHNALNASAAAAVAAGEGVPGEAVAEALASFRSVKRRLEVRAEIRGITIIEDFAHHPTAIRETLRALRARYPEGRLWAVLEPRSNTLRRNVFQRELVESLALADQIVLADVYRAENIPEAERLHPANVIAELQQRGKPAQLLANADAIVTAIAPELRSGDVVALLSNGGFDGIYEKLPQRLRQQK
jgi:UDP-N-acetylmuramate: L-alanyl-gamma-D-glutamyl-meso-diaminopimelate ligase